MGSWKAWSPEAAKRSSPPPPPDDTSAIVRVLDQQATDRKLRQSRGSRGAFAFADSVLGGTEPYRAPGSKVTTGS